ncbi:MAG TPA: TIGR00341 family protein [Candidatus Bathyarchaeia archaeon]|nr:TIGR00341 family protein [Candidatus Bathyarchaeia archaeon]
MVTAGAKPRSRFRGLFRPPEEIYREVSEGRQFDSLYFSMLVFGCLIALLGLLLNSPAVIIGAMLISPLMGPILSCGLAMTLADSELARKAGRNLGLSILETIVIAAVATALSPLKEATPEILARTNPNVMDLLVAFFSGAAGTLALCSSRPGFTIVPGVAIATAVMPPLATVGFGISTRQWLVASGAFMLFVTNLASIVVSADIVFLMIGMRRLTGPAREEQSWWVRHRLLISWAILAVLAVPLAKTLRNAAEQRRIQDTIRTTLQQRLDRPGARRVDELTVQMGKNTVSAEAVVQTSELVLPSEQMHLQQQLEKQLGRHVILHLDQIQLANPNAPTGMAERDYVAGGKIRPAAEEAKRSPAEIMKEFSTAARTQLAPVLRAAGLQSYHVVSVGEESAGTLVVRLQGTYQDDAIAVQSWDVICAAIAQNFKLPVHLIATVTLPASKIVWLPYRGESARPSATELRGVERKLTAWKKQKLQFGFVAAPGGDAELTGARIEYLKSRLGEGESVPATLGIGDDVATNAVGLAAMQSIEVYSAAAEQTEP